MTAKELADRIYELIERGTINAQAKIILWDCDYNRRKFEIDLNGTSYNCLELDTVYS